MLPFQLVCQILSVTPKGWAEEQACAARRGLGDGPVVSMDTLQQTNMTGWKVTIFSRRITGDTPTQIAVVF